MDVLAVGVGDVLDARFPARMIGDEKYWPTLNSQTQRQIISVLEEDCDSYSGSQIPVPVPVNPGNPLPVADGE